MYWWFSCDVTWPQNPLNSSFRYHFFDSRNGYSSVMLPIFSFLVIILVKYVYSSCNSKISIFPKLKSFVWGGHVGWHVQNVTQHGCPIQNCYNLELQLLRQNYDCKTKNWRWLKWPTCIHFWSQKSGISAMYQGILWWHEVTWKPRIV